MEITLNMGIGSGDIQTLTFYTDKDVLEYIDTLVEYDCVWLITEDGEQGEIRISESASVVHQVVMFRLMSAVLLDEDVKFHIHEYESYESAYAVALNMKEDSPKCYDK